ncbi:hypothetical protein ACN6LI_000677, partial [Streptomyces violaceoruber]
QQGPGVGVEHAGREVQVPDLAGERPPVLPYLLDLGTLKGRRLLLGAQFSSPPAAVQSALF